MDNRIPRWFPTLFLIYVQNSGYHSSSLCDFLDLWLNYYEKTKGEIMFYVVGERINTSRKKVQEAGAVFIDVNAGHESVMKWRT